MDVQQGGPSSLIGRAAWGAERGADLLFPPVNFGKFITPSFDVECGCLRS